LLGIDVKEFILYPCSLSPELNDIKLFMAGIYKFSLKARAFVSGRPLQPSLMFLGEAA
jgi:hypothetical protein